ncbi:Gfo/Idh/MocA family protein [Miniphocaeibacter halophilus]|uniref:Gfo/Idh/MocA family oxidoreductase n=1 Tax=Miniphocaeibacter halophilus TaxID=2931922 RepID=A0AC61MPL6_9FIRM|nr:Gfo/Idh/MocA family oxidoreductase [Miniphocaeibacter halophilus]QQK07467.1 Gfo/Idh/MocA family oxidoreductase [Miniphocaeibacter halophilus]
MRFGIIGSNFIVKDFLAAAKLNPDFEFTAMYSRDLKKAETFGKEHGAKYFYDDLDEMFKSDIDAVYIASPIGLHEEQSIKALKAGIHVLCEKVATTTVESIDRIIKVAKENNKMFMEAMISTVTPTFKEIKNNLHKLGKIRRVVFQFNQYSSRYDNLKKGVIENAFKPELGNGALTDIGIYTIEPIVHLFGKPNSVMGSNKRLITNAIGFGTGILEYDEFQAIIMYSKIFNSYSESEIIGEEGVLSINKISLPSKFEIKYRNGDYEFYENSQNIPLMYYEIEEFINCIKEGKIESEINTHKITRDSIEVIEYLWNK